jgi:hypothetical protein
VTRLTDTRVEIAAALSSVAGVTGTPYPPRTIARGMGWPEWSYSEPSTYQGDQATWLVHVVLPAGTPESVAIAADELIEEITAALDEIAAVTRYEPSSFIPEAGGDQTLPAITYTLTTV